MLAAPVVPVKAGNDSLVRIGLPIKVGPFEVSAKSESDNPPAVPLPSRLQPRTTPSVFWFISQVALSRKRPGKTLQAALASTAVKVPTVVQVTWALFEVVATN